MHFCSMIRFNIFHFIILCKYIFELLLILLFVISFPYSIYCFLSRIEEQKTRLNS